MRQTSVLQHVIGVEDTVVERVVEACQGRLVVAVKPRAKQRRRCSVCNRKAKAYDRGRRRRWRHVRVGMVRLYLEADAPRVKCRRHGVRVAAVPWARAGSRFTRAFEDEVAWSASQMSKLAVVRSLGIAWRSVGSIVTRVVAEGLEHRPPLRGLRHIGIDETSYRRGHRYLTVVVNHDTGTLVWAAEGARKEILARFFEELGPQGCARIEAVTMDAAPWIRSTVSEYCPGARQCLDPFHVVRWAGDAVEQARREQWSAHRLWLQRGEERRYRDLRWVLRRDPGSLSDGQQRSLADLQRVNEPLYRAYLLKEQLREVFQVGGEAGIGLLNEWLTWARRCQISSMVKVASTITEHLPAIHATLRLGLSNARIEAFNGRFQLINRRAYGFHSAAAAIALAFLCLAGYCPELPGYR